ncbi:MAG: type II toxin-antitoxin system prevent-host-death family antitoxin [Acidobacteria bacterium]|nr:type II toxin-antitoxin system prevent-host-death family antitoxin [Acidobacteriota bacterium]
MQSVNIADLKNNLSRYLARVREGAELTVLDRDTPVARIVPFATRAAGRRGAAGRAAEPSESKQRLAELQRLGIVGTGDPDGLADLARTHAPVKLPKGTPSAVDLLIQMRRESKR